MEKTNNGRFLIITGGTVDYKWAQEWLEKRKYEFVITADSGLVHADKLGIIPDLILGDYDSVNSEIIKKYRDDKNNGEKYNIMTFPPEKDYTDTHLAFVEALKYDPLAIDIIGATGSRLDHSMTNIFLLKHTVDSNTETSIYDKNNKIYMCNSRKTIKKNEQFGKFISFIPVTDDVVITAQGMKYPMNKFLLKKGVSICQSNEIKDETAQILIEKGIALIFETID